MTNLVVDANIFLRFLLKDIPRQYSEAEKLFRRAKAGEITLIVPQIVIFEIAFALQKFYGFPKEEVVDKLKSLVDMEYFLIQDRQIFQEALKIFAVNNISLVDSFLIYLASSKQAKLITFDEKLTKI